MRKETALEFNRKGLWPRKNELFWNELSDILPSITKIEFFGGEPLLIEQHYKILEECVEKDLAKNIEVCYNTNGSIYPEQYIDLYKNFKNVHFFFSIDAIGEQFDYIRHPNNFDSVLVNLKKFFKLVEENVNIGCSVFETDWCMWDKPTTDYESPL